MSRQQDPNIYMIEQLREEIRRCPNKQLNTEQMAQQVHYSTRHIARIFEKNVGLSPNEYQHLVRLCDAAQTLLTSRYTLEEIAQQHGYSGARSFGRAFGRLFGCTPGRYRRDPQQLDLRGNLTIADMLCVRNVPLPSRCVLRPQQSQCFFCATDSACVKTQDKQGFTLGFAHQTERLNAQIVFRINRQLLLRMPYLCYRLEAHHSSVAMLAQDDMEKGIPYVISVCQDGCATEDMRAYLNQTTSQDILLFLAVYRLDLDTCSDAVFHYLTLSDTPIT